MEAPAAVSFISSRARGGIPLLAVVKSVPLPNRSQKIYFKKLFVMCTSLNKASSAAENEKEATAKKSKKGLLQLFFIVLPLLPFFAEPRKSTKQMQSSA